MSSLTPDSRKRGDGQRKRKAARASAKAAESEVEDRDGSMHAQSRASYHSKHPPKAQEPPRNIVFKIKGDVNKISFDLIPDQRQSRHTAARPKTKQASHYAAQCDTPDDLSSESEESRSSSEDETDCNPPARPKRSINQRTDPRVHARRPSKRDQPDEGYHTSSTAYTAGVNKKTVKGKSKEGVLPSRASHQLLEPTRVSSQAKHKKSRTVTDNLGSACDMRSDSESDECSENSAEEVVAESGESENDQADMARDDEDDEDDENEDDDDASEDQDESEDDFNKLAIQINGAGNQDAEALDVKAVLDTGTKPDWISQNFYQTLKKIGIKSTKLTPEEQERKYKDFQSKSFSPTSKVNLLVQSDDFPGKVKSRSLSFFICRNASFSILIGSDTIRKQCLFERTKPDAEGEGAHVGVHGAISEAEKAEIKKKKELREKTIKAQKRQREEKNEEIIREKRNAKATRSSNDSAHLATMVVRGGRTRSPPRSSNDVVRQQLERKSNSSLEGTW